MICCICGEPIEIGEAVLRIQQFVLGVRPRRNEAVLRPVPLEDGSAEKYAHPVCPVMAGAPRELVGAEGGRINA